MVTEITGTIIKCMNSGTSNGYLCYGVNSKVRIDMPITKITKKRNVEANVEAKLGSITFTSVSSTLVAKKNGTELIIEEIKW